MLFLTFFDPELIAFAAKRGAPERQQLLRMLGDFSINCCLAEIDDWKIKTGLKEAVDHIEDVNFRNRVQKHLMSLKMQGRLVPCICDEYDPDKSDVQLAVEQAPKACLDLIATEVNCDQWRQAESPETCSLLTYGESAFCEHRNEQATYGCTCAAGELNGDALLRTMFAPVVRYCKSLDIVDKMWGPKFGDSFEHSTKRLIDLIAQSNSSAANCPITIHTAVVEPNDAEKHKRRIAYIDGQLRQLHFPGGIKVLFYPERELPHDRFVWTNQIALIIGRGLDFLSRHDDASRDVTINLKRRTDIEKLTKGLLPVDPLEVPPYQTRATASHG